MSNYIYLLCENLKDEVKTRHKIKVERANPRVDVMLVTGYYEPLQYLKNPKGMIFFDVLGTDGKINSSDRRRSDVWLQCSACNFSSVYFMDFGKENEIFGHGNPSDDEFFTPKKVKSKDGTIKTIPKPNPFYKNNRYDGFIFIAKPDYSSLEIIIVPNGRYYIQSECNRYINGKMDEVLATLRAEAKPIFHY